MKKVLVIGIDLIALISLLTACGISQEEYDAVVAERDAAKAEVASIQSELSDMENMLKSTQG
jgi:hypothetical protein